MKYYISIYDCYDKHINIPIKEIPTTDQSIKNIVSQYVDCRTILIDEDITKGNKHYIECTAIAPVNFDTIVIIRNYKVKKGN